MTTPDPTDDELLRRLRRGDEEAFTVLYHRWQGPLYRFALQMAGAAATAEDVVQEVFMVLIRGAEHYDATRGRLASYLYGVARNHVRRRLERDRPLAFTGALGQDALPALATNEDALGELSRQDTIRRVRAAVLSLPTHYREPVVLCDLQGLSYEAAADALGCAVGTVRSRLHRGRDLLVAKLALRAATPARSGPGRVAEGVS